MKTTIQVERTNRFPHHKDSRGPQTHTLSWPENVKRMCKHFPLQPFTGLPISIYATEVLFHLFALNLSS